MRPHWKWIPDHDANEPERWVLHDPIGLCRGAVEAFEPTRAQEGRGWGIMASPMGSVIGMFPSREAAMDALEESVTAALNPVATGAVRPDPEPSRVCGAVSKVVTDRSTESPGYGFVELSCHLPLHHQGPHELEAGPRLRARLPEPPRCRALCWVDQSNTDGDAEFVRCCKADGHADRHHFTTGPYSFASPGSIGHLAE